ncbi:DUF393 domain-containing protein [Roseibium denhamense]|uniref:DUF393 domain-containing protein n=1 Tax=Roseibium denhamense TaxID=76305 RepID=A0ABY1N7N7_9HYPH|nr:DUF393 domain-containing protein [Roseibium denhamense]MTI05971.1 DUF393 domain-containing protein [Roseibium denhamense]SMP02635.1 Protein of unknown function, DUF393 [Roseibium denhamense]
MHGANVPISPSAGTSGSRQLTVFFDGGCPVCVMEVAYYRRIDKAGTVTWVDIGSLSDAELPNGKSREDLLGIFHVLTEDGTWVIGVDAFAAIWRNLPGFRHFAWLFKTPVIRQAAGVFYKGFLMWQKRHRAKREKNCKSVPAE